MNQDQGPVPERKRKGGSDPHGELDAREERPSSPQDIERLAEVYLAADSYGEAMRLYEELIRNAERTGVGNSHLAGWLLKKASCLSSQGRHLEAIVPLSRAERILGPQDDPHLLERVLAERASVLRHLDRFEEARATCQRAIEILEHCPDPREEARLNLSLGSIETRLGNLTEAQAQFLSALSMFKSQGDKEGLAKAYNDLGVVYKILCWWSQSVAYLQRAVTQFEDRGDSLGVARCHLNLGVVYVRQGMWREARESLTKALEGSEKLGNSLSMARSLIALGGLETLVRDWKRAAEHLYRGYALVDGRGYHREISIAHEYLGDFWMARGDTGQAQEHYEKALDRAVSTNPVTDLVAQIARRLARLHCDLGDLDSAESFCRRCEDVSRRVGEKREEAILRRIEAELLARREEGTAAREAMHDAIAMLEYVGDRFELAKAHLSMYHLLGQIEGSGRQAKTREHLLAACVLFRKVGASYELEEVEDLLAGIEEQAGLFRPRLRYATPSKTGTEQPVAAVQPRVRTECQRTAGATGWRYGIVTTDPGLLRIVAEIPAGAKSRLPVLITGPTGTGKELVARAIHQAMGKSLPMIPVNCASVGEGSMQESTLFGHVRGAFTGAHRDHAGVFEEADGGVVFLDEISEMSNETQVRLLRVLESGELRRLGETKIRRVNVRVISATNKNLAELNASGRFRDDLYYRIRGIEFHTSPLVERPGDIDILMDYFLERHLRESGRRCTLSPEVREIFRSYHWPGNVRELDHEIGRLVAFAEDGSEIGLDHIPARMLSGDSELAPQQHGGASGEEAGDPGGAEGWLKSRVQKLERQAITEALRRTEGNVTKTAKMLGLSRQGLRKKMKALQINSSEILP